MAVRAADQAECSGVDILITPVTPRVTDPIRQF